MMPLLLSCLSVAGLLFLWFQTTAILEYAQLVGLGRVLGLPRWLEARQKIPELTWLNWLKVTYGSATAKDRLWRILFAFFIRGISCPYCLAMWFSIVAAFAVGHWQWIPAIYCGAIIIYRRI